MRALVPHLLRYPRLRQRSLHTARAIFLSLFPQPTASLLRSDHTQDIGSFRPYTIQSSDEDDRYMDDHHQQQQQRRQAGTDTANVTGAVPSNDKITRSTSVLPAGTGTGTTSIKKINKALSRRQVPELVEEELEEQFVRGAVFSSFFSPSRVRRCCWLTFYG